MSAFDDLRTELADRRTHRARAASELSVERERLRKLQREVSALGRASDRRRIEELNALRREAEAATGRVEALRGNLAAIDTDAGRLLGRLTELADPTELVGQWNDAFPIALFPVRIETRFHRPEGGLADRGAPRVPQLWIRVYPDDCHVDSFEELLTESELANARTFWADMWSAGGVEAEQRGAWSGLVGGSGSGRAAYILQQYKPANPADAPAKIDPQDVALAIVPEIDVTPAEQAAACAYWIAVWTADGDKAQEQAALAALRAAVGNTRADEIRKGFAPAPRHMDPPTPYTRAQVRVSCAVLSFPPAPPTKTNAWTQAPRARALPDRFVALLFNGGSEVKRAFGRPIPDGLAMGPDPSLPPDQQIKKDGDDLALNEELQWMSDFDRAVDVGLGFRLDLTPAEAAGGFDRLIVIGLRFSWDENEGSTGLSTLVAHRYASKQGFGLVPQGSPTNNTEGEGAAYTWIDDADGSYDIIFKGKEAYADVDDPLERRDGQWLSEALGIDRALMKVIPHAGGRDQLEARAMNLALWPATLGYAMEEMLTPLFPPADIEATRRFFTLYVSGRGPLPAVRFGRQPYGILPVMPFARYEATRRRGDVFGIAHVAAGADAGASYLQRLHALLMRLDADWRAMSASVAHVARPGADAHQTLLDIVGLHSGSVEYHQRYAESFDQLYNTLTLQYGALWGSLLADWLKNRSEQLLTAIGADPAAQPPILEKFFHGHSPLLTGPVVDDAPLSETVPIRGYTPDRKNYIEWLAASPLDVIRRADFGGNPAPTALLYLMLRHAILLGNWDAGIRMLESRGLLAAATARREPSFVHVEDGPTAGESKFQHLYAAQPLVTGDSTTMLAEYVLLPSVLANAPETMSLRGMLGALEILQGVPTARLERLFAEHIDCCSYRLDAWKSALAAARLQEMRAAGGQQPTTGVYVGAFGWLENLRPNPQTLEGVPLDAELQPVFARAGEAPLRHDPANAGYIHAPSLNHGVAAAILKNAYRVNATPARPDAMAVNLSSERVRHAMALLEGVRNGQTLSALLGYRFERGLHDAHNLAEVDKFIYPLRQKLPLVANRLKSTKTDDATDVTLIEARNVIDGLKLVTRVRTPGQASYPFGWPTAGPGALPPATLQERAAIDAEANAISDLYDAVADLVLAESTYQVVLGNFDRAAANTSAFSKGSYPPDAQVVRTPRTGLSLTHRLALHLDAAANPNVSPSAVPMTPRAKADAALNLWVAGRMPDPANVVVSVTCSSPVLAAKTVTLSQADLRLQPIDLLYLANLDLEQAASELDDRIVQAVRYGPDRHPALAITIGYTQPVPGSVTIFELAALVRSLRPLLLESRALGPIDMTLPLEATPGDAAWDAAELEGRVAAAIAALTTRRNALVTLATDAADADVYAQKLSDEFLQVALFGIPQTGVGQIHADVRAIHDAIAAKVREFVTRWQEKAAEYATLLATWPSLVTDEERFAVLSAAEGLIASTTTAVLPADPNVYKTTIVEPMKTLFDARLAQMQALLVFAGDKVVDFAAAASALPPLLSQHDAVPFDVAGQNAAIASLRDTLVARVVSLAADLTARLDDAQTAVTAAAAAESVEARVEQLRAAARRVLGDEIQLVPLFRLPPGQGFEFQSAFDASGTLLTDLVAGGRRFPVDDWLYGLARVREKCGAIENVAVLSEAFGAPRLQLDPVQLPFTADDHWLALECDPAAAGAANRLLYTALFDRPFDRTANQCGLLLDEWPEVVPATDVVSGVTFHFDRPGSQPPQAILLAVPPVLRGSWQWDDLVATLLDTLDAAKARAVEPMHVDASNYAQFLPATLMAVTLYQITIGTNLAMNNRIYEVMKG